jgi:capsular polysaccharide biosynthesis protein
VISVSVIHAPESDEKPDKPKHLTFAAVGFVAGLMSMGIAILYFLLFRDSIITTESLERTLNLRVLGAVPDMA